MTTRGNTGERRKQLEVAQDPVIDATIEQVTDICDFGRGYNWSVQSVLTGTDGTPQLQILGSNDGVNFVNVYCDNEGNPLSVDLNAVSNAVFDDIFPFDQFRVKILPNDNTTGTLELFLNLHFE